MKKLTLLVAVLAIFVSFEASAWGRIGHRTIAEIAERNLTPKAKANIEKYTQGTPLADYSLWMDQVRKDDEVSAHATRGWHASIVDSNCKTSQALRDKYRKGRDSVTGVIELGEMLKEREKLSDSVVMFALKSIIHMVGDMHCPAHIRFTDFENQGKFSIKFFGKKSTLHKVWDTSVLTRNYKGWTYGQYADKLNTLSKSEVKRTTKGWLEDWMEESGRQVRPVLRKVNQGDELDDEFMSWAYPLAESQTQKAGYRLAKVLNTFFK